MFSCNTRLTGCDTKTSHEIICHGPDRRLPLQRHPPSLDQTIDRYANDECDVQPVNMLVPVGLGDGGLSDVWFLGIV